MTDRLVSGDYLEEDLNNDNHLRPKSLTNYIGQESVKSNLTISIEAAKQRSEPLDHVLLYGPPGLGKTTLSNIISNEMGVQIKTTAGPAIERAGDMVSLLTQMQENDILFIDEIHRLNRIVEEVLYPAMEDYFVTWVIDQGLKARSMNLQLKPFTLIGATTRYGLMSAPLRDRFGSIYRLEFYNNEEMAQILQRTARILDVEFDKSGITEIAKRSRGTPRVGNRLLRRVRDFAQIKFNNYISQDVALTALETLKIDNLGLDNTDISVLKCLIEKFEGGPVGIDTIAASINEAPETIEDVYEPYLLQLGFIDRTKRGRIATARAYKHLEYDLGFGKTNDTIQTQLDFDKD